MAYDLVNPAAGNVYFDRGGTATTATTQPVINIGVGTNIGTTTNLSGINANVGDQETYGSQIVSGLVGGIEHPVSGGNANFATLTEGRYIMRRGGTNTEFIHGAAFTVLRSAGSEYGIRRSIHKVESIYTTHTTQAMRAGLWDSVNGVWNTGDIGVSWVNNFGLAQPVSNNASGIGNVAGGLQTDGGADHAALPSSVLPGELVYKEPQPNPVQDDYKERFLW